MVYLKIELALDFRLGNLGFSFFAFLHLSSLLFWGSCAPGGGRRAKGSPKELQGAPQETPREPQEVPRDPRRPQGSPKGHQRVPKGTQGPPKGFAKNGTHRYQNVTKTPLGTKGCPRAPL